MKRINADAIVLAGSSGQALAFGPGHVERTPDAGEPGVAIYSAHRDTHFRFLKDVAIGDEIEITRRDGKTFRYRADGSSVVRFDALEIDAATSRRELILSTCWPFDAVTSGPLRYVLHATAVETADDATRLACTVYSSPISGIVALRSKKKCKTTKPSAWQTATP